LFIHSQTILETTKIRIVTYKIPNKKLRTQHEISSVIIAPNRRKASEERKPGPKKTWVEGERRPKKRVSRSSEPKENVAEEKSETKGCVGRRKEWAEDI